MVNISVATMRSTLHGVWDKRRCRLLSSYPPGVSPCWEFPDSDYVSRSCSWHVEKAEGNANVLRIEFEEDPRKILSELTEEELMTPPTTQDMLKYFHTIDLKSAPEQTYLEVHRDHVLHKRALVEAEKLEFQYLDLQKKKQSLEDKLDNMNNQLAFIKRELANDRTTAEQYLLLRIESLQKEHTLAKERVAGSRAELGENFFLYFKQLVGKKLVVELDDLTVVRGNLLRCDESLNMVLENAVVLNQEKCSHKEYHFKGSEVCAVTPPDDCGVWPLFPSVKALRQD